MTTPMTSFATCLALLAMSTSALAQATGQFAAHQDIGAVKRVGAFGYDDRLQQYRISASGTNTWFADDQMHYAYNRMQGDFIVRAQVAFEGKGVDPHRKAGWDVRAGLGHASAHVVAAVHGDGLASLQFRDKEGAETNEYRMQVKAPDVIQLERRGDVYIMSAARFGEPFQVTSVSHVKLGDKVYVGLAATAHNRDAYETMKISNVRITVPAAKDFVPYKDYIGSNIEILDMATGTTARIATGAAVHNNNDHVLSWNGKLIFTGQRDAAVRANSPKVLNLYAIDLATRKETQLTHTQALDDGAEYSPDGKQIYFNSNRTGLMQLWRMSADAKNQVQLTFDRFNNWFPHVSPDGKKIVFISFMDDIDPYDHPFYRHVYLREMPVEGGTPRIIAYLYGGQGTMNVPSWSPDGRQIAFVSNTKQ